jgi:hypothetical protein
MMLPAQRNVDIIRNIPIKRELVTREPDPELRLIPLIGWLKKRGGMREVSQCNVKWKKEGIKIEDEVKKIGTDLICIYRTRGGKKVVVLEDKAWADQWLVYYDAEVPHHSQPEKTKIKFLDTERKV